MLQTPSEFVLECRLQCGDDFKVHVTIVVVPDPWRTDVPSGKSSPNAPLNTSDATCCVVSRSFYLAGVFFVDAGDDADVDDSRFPF